MLLFPRISGTRMLNDKKLEKKETYSNTVMAITIELLKLVILKFISKIIINLHTFYNNFFHIFAVLDDARLWSCKFYDRFNTTENL
jgi:hypothetical protein